MAENGLTRVANETAGEHRWYHRLARPYCLLWDACYNYMRVTWMGNLRTSVRLQTANQFYLPWKILLLVARAMQWARSSW